MSARPFVAAIISGVRPHLETTFGLAPASRSARACSSFPRYIAVWCKAEMSFSVYGVGINAGVQQHNESGERGALSRRIDLVGGEAFVVPSLGTRIEVNPTDGHCPTQCRAVRGAGDREVHDREAHLRVARNDGAALDQQFEPARLVERRCKLRER
jgi:hypothetical protein